MSNRTFLNSFFLAFTYACSLKECFSRKRILVLASFGSARTRTNRVFDLILGLENYIFIQICLLDSIPIHFYALVKPFKLVLVMIALPKYSASGKFQWKILFFEKKKKKILLASKWDFQIFQIILIVF
jgi:hypothetical protein